MSRTSPRIALALLGLMLLPVALPAVPLQKPNEARIAAVAFSPDGKTLATANTSGAIQLWDTATGAAGATLSDLQTVVPFLIEATRDKAKFAREAAAAAPQRIGPESVNRGEKKPEPVAEKAVRDALAKFDKDWRDYTNEAHFGEPRWKLKMHTLAALARAWAAAVPLLEEAVKEGSAWAPHTRYLASEMLAIVRGPKSILDALASYDLSHVDSAKTGKPAPDFALADASGQSYGLRQFRGKKTVVLTFILQDIWPG